MQQFQEQKPYCGYFPHERLRGKKLLTIWELIENNFAKIRHVIAGQKYVNTDPLECRMFG